MVEILKKFNVKFKGGQLERSIITATKEEAEIYFKNKYPKREIESIKED